MGEYWLRRDVFWCRCPHWFVFLDLARNRYFCIRPADPAALAPVLLKRGILAVDSEGGKPLQPTPFVAPARDLRLGAWVARRRVSVRSMSCVLSCLARAAWGLERSSLFDLIARLLSSRPATEKAAPVDRRELRRRMAEFQTVRPWFPRRYRCLFDSLAAAHYLTHFGLFPALVLGVQAEPFEAHCWLQAGEAVVNDTVDHVRGFTPIMVV